MNRNRLSDNQIALRIGSDVEHDLFGQSVVPSCRQECEPVGGNFSLVLRKIIVLA
jgi:hypothetical protein